MKQVNSVAFMAIFGGIWAVFAGLGLLKGGLYLGKHEVDALHVLDILARLDLGQRIHQDFQTPIGLIAFAPIRLFMHMGMGAGMAFIAAQTLVGLLLLPAIYRVVSSRMTFGIGCFFGLAVLTLAMAMVHGGSDPASSISMHYNRWAWAIGFVVIAAAVLPARRSQRQSLDGVIIGTGLGVLACLKVTYFVGFFPGVIVALILHRQFRAIFAGLVAGLAVAALVTLWQGVDFWLAYMHDLQTVASSKIRPYPGAKIGDLIGGAKGMAITAAVLAAVMFLRQAGRETTVIALVLLLPGFYYVTYQNFGNDPIWLVLLACLIWSSRPRSDRRNGAGIELRSALNVVVFVALAVVSPAFVNLLKSPLAHFAVDTSKYHRFTARFEDVQTANLRSYKIEGAVPLDGANSGLEAYAVLAERPEPDQINGVVLGACQVRLGMVSVFEEIGKSLAEQGLVKDQNLYVADITSAHWMYSDALPPVGSAPWYYGDLSGIEAADLLVVPVCAVHQAQRGRILKSIAERDDILLEELAQTPLYRLFRINRI